MHLTLIVYITGIIERDPDERSNYKDLKSIIRGV